MNSNSTKTKDFQIHLPDVQTAERQTRTLVSEGETVETVDLDETFLLLVPSVASKTLFLLNQKEPTYCAATALKPVRDGSIMERGRSRAISIVVMHPVRSGKTGVRFYHGPQKQLNHSVY